MPEIHRRDARAYMDSIPDSRKMVCFQCEEDNVTSYLVKYKNANGIEEPYYRKCLECDKVYDKRKNAKYVSTITALGNTDATRVKL